MFTNEPSTDAATLRPVTWTLKEQVGTDRMYHLYVDSSSLNTIVEGVLQKRAETFTLAGFRPGKVPLSLVRNQLGNQVREQEINRVISDALQDIQRTDNLRPSSYPSIEVDQALSNAKTLVLNVTIPCLPVLPEIDMPSTRISLNIPDADISTAAVEEAKRELLDNSLKYEAASDAVSQTGDMIVIDFEGKLKSVDAAGSIIKEDFPGNKAVKLPVTIGENQFIAGFEEGLKNLKAGDKKELELTFPTDYHEESLAGKPVLFSVHVHEVLRSKKPESFDEGLLSRLGVSTMEDLESEIRKRLEFDAAVLKRVYTKKVLFDALDHLYDSTEIPAGLLESEVASIGEDTKRQLLQEGGVQEKDVEAKIQEIAARRVRLGIVLSSMAKHFNVSVTPEDIEEAQKVEALRNNNGSGSGAPLGQQDMVRMQASIMEEKIVNEMLAQLCDVQTTQLPYAEFKKKCTDELNAAFSSNA